MTSRDIIRKKAEEVLVFAATKVYHSIENEDVLLPLIEKALIEVHNAAIEEAAEEQELYVRGVRLNEESEIAIRVCRELKENIIALKLPESES